jgi:Ca2+-binding RTX toxin-like protein
LIALIGAAEARGASCTYDAGSQIVTATIEGDLEGRILRSGKAIVFYESSTDQTLACGNATVTNTRRIDITGTGETSDTTNATMVTIDESAGRLAPGAGRERTDASEIEVRISVAPGENASSPATQVPLWLVYVGTPRSDRVVAGTLGVDARGDGDVDVWPVVHPFGELMLTGAGGNDQLSGGGSPATGAAVRVPARLHGGLGDDSLRGGAAADTLEETAAAGGGGYDLLIGGAGPDVLRGGPLNDRLRGGPGEDELSGNSGHDAFFAKDGVADALFGGDGFDEAVMDKGLDVANAIENFF